MCHSKYELVFTEQTQKSFTQGIKDFEQNHDDDRREPKSFLFNRMICLMPNYQSNNNRENISVTTGNKREKLCNKIPEQSGS